MLYKRRNGPRGRSLFFMDGHMVSPKNIPPEIKTKLEIEDSYDTEGIVEEPSKPDKYCLFCGQLAEKVRIADGRTIDLCNNDYYQQSLGKIVTKLRSLDETQKETSQEGVLDAT